MKRAVTAAGLLFGLALLASAPPLPDRGPGKLSATGPTKTFTGENLYDHIDGGAELFLELGFERCEVRRYASKGAEVTLERYRMRDAAAALGIYFLQRGRGTSDPTLSERHTLGPNQLLLVKGQTLLRLTGTPGRCPSQQQLAAFARELASALAASEEPDPFLSIPAKGRIAGSERVARGPVSLSALAPPFDPGGLPLEGGTALVADYGAAGGRTHIFLDMADASSAEKVLDSLAAHLEAGTTGVSRSPGALSWKDASGRPGEAVAEGRRLRIAWGGASPTSG